GQVIDGNAGGDDGQLSAAELEIAAAGERRAGAERVWIGVENNRAACGGVEDRCARAAGGGIEGAALDVDGAAVVEAVVLDGSRSGGDALPEGSGVVEG